MCPSCSDRIRSCCAPWRPATKSPSRPEALASWRSCTRLTERNIHGRAVPQTRMGTGRVGAGRRRTPVLVSLSRRPVCVLVLRRHDDVWCLIEVFSRTGKVGRYRTPSSGPVRASTTDSNRGRVVNVAATRSPCTTTARSTSDQQGRVSRSGTPRAPGRPSGWRPRASAVLTPPRPVGVRSVFTDGGFTC